jgi:hypothetical protein
VTYYVHQPIKARDLKEVPAMSQRRANVVYFDKWRASMPPSSNTRLDSIRCVMARANLRTSPPVAEKAARLHAVAPDIAKIVEDMLDDLLAEVS